MKRRAIIWVLGIAAFPAVLSSSCSPSGYSGPTESVTLGIRASEVASLVYVAENQGYLSANGINMVLKEYDSGVGAADALINGEVDLAACAEFVAVGHVMQGQPIRGIAVIDKFENTYVIARRDKGISGVTDLKGKRIGVVRGASDEFYLGRFLEINGMTIGQVTVANVTRARSFDLLVSGEVDALCAIQPQIYLLERELGNNAVTWPAQSGQLDYFSVVAKDSWVATHPKTIERIIKSLVQAEDYIISHPDRAESIIQERLRYDQAYVRAVLPEHDFTVSLDQALILAMEDETRWLISNSLTAEKNVPDFLKYVYADGLKAVRPEAVGISGE